MNRDQNGEGEEYKDRLGRRDRLDHAFCDDEPHEDPFNPDYQLVLDEAFAAHQDKNRGLGEIIMRLERNEQRAMSPYQNVRTEYLIAEYYCELDAELDTRRVPDSAREHDPVGSAADHFGRAADVAKGIPDWALFAQLKHRESRVCHLSHPYRRRYRRAFAAAKEALDAWLSLPHSHLTADMTFGFDLGDTLGVCGQLIAEDAEAVRGLEYAAQMLHGLQECPDRDSKGYANDDLFLDWDWAFLYYTMGYYRHAFRKARATRKKGNDLFSVADRVRFQALVADIVLACAAEGQVEDYSRARLLAAAERALDEAYRYAAECKKQGEAVQAAYAMVLLADATWMGLSNVKAGRVAKIEEAQEIAQSRADPLLLGQVEIAWGDEYVFRYLSRPGETKAQTAEKHYRRAIEILDAVEALSLARIAQRRLALLHRPAPVPGKPQRMGRTPNAPLPDEKIRLN
ncbi:MAG: hypothetical protein ACM3N4_12015 [Nitrososphaerota archaeon]